jgi:copper(I)-binding protein
MKIASGIILAVALLAGALWWVSGMSPDEPLVFENPRARLVPGNAPMAGYFELGNNTENRIHLVSARSDAFRGIMIHRTRTVDGQARMEHQDRVSVSSGQTVSFEPGGLHLMLMNRQREFEIGDEVDIVLVFEGLEPAERTVTFTVVPVTES